jgi:hypothetical protein
VRGGDQCPLAIHLLQAPQQEPAQDPGFLDLPVHRLLERLLLRRSLRLALGVDLGALLASALADHAGLGVVLAPVARVLRHHIRQCTNAVSDAPQHGIQVLAVFPSMPLRGKRWAGL